MVRGLIVRERPVSEGNMLRNLLAAICDGITATVCTGIFVFEPCLYRSPLCLVV